MKHWPRVLYFAVYCLLIGCGAGSSGAERATDGAAVREQRLRAVQPLAGSAFYELGLDDALAKAGLENKVVMIDFYTTWCKPCKMLDAETWKNEDVVAWLRERTVALKVDAGRRRDLKQRFAVNSYPTLLFLRPDGSEAGRTFGYQPPQEFLRQARLVVGRETAGRQ